MAMMDSDMERALDIAAERDAARAEVERMQRERDEALRLAYIGEHRFPDLTWKARAEEAGADLAAARAENARLRRVVEAARGLLDALPRCENKGCGKLAIFGHISHEPRWCIEHRRYGRDGFAHEVDALLAALDTAEVGR